MKTQPPEPPIGTVLETRDSIDEYRIERARDGWAVQYREGENEFGQPLATGRISWESAWRAWLGGGSQPVRQVQPGAPSLPPYEEEDDPYAGMGTDATNQRLDPPPATQPWTPKGAAGPSPYSSEHTARVAEAKANLDVTTTRYRAWSAGKSDGDGAQLSRDFNARIADYHAAVNAAEQVTNNQHRHGPPRLGKDATNAKFDPPPAAQPWTAKGADVNEATKGAVEGVSKITPTGLATTALSGATGKDIKSPMAAAATGGTTSGGSGMSHASEGNAQIQQAGQDIEGAMGAIQEIVNQLTQAQQNLMAAADESQHSEADAAKGALEQAITAANDLQQQVGAAKQAVEDVRL